MVLIYISHKISIEHPSVGLALLAQLQICFDLKTITPLFIFILVRILQMDCGIEPHSPQIDITLSGHSSSSVFCCCFMFCLFVCLFVCLLPVNQSLQALQASAAQVRLEPTTKMPQRNSVFYLRQPGVTRKDFTPRNVCSYVCACERVEFSSRRIL